MKYEYYQDINSEWRWRLIAANGNILAVSSEAYINKSDCLSAIGAVKSAGFSSVVEVDK